MKRLLLAAGVVGLFLGAAGLGRAQQQAKSYMGKVTSLDAQSRKISIKFNKPDTNGTVSGNWTVAEKATIGSGNKHFPLSGVHVGDEVSVAVTDDGVIHTLGVLHPSKGGTGGAKGGKPAPQKIVSGVITSLPGQETVVIQVGQQSMVFKLVEKGFVRDAVGKKPPYPAVPFSALQNGQHVQVLAEGDKAGWIRITAKK